MPPLCIATELDRYFNDLAKSAADRPWPQSVAAELARFCANGTAREPAQQPGLDLLLREAIVPGTSTVARAYLKACPGIASNLKRIIERIASDSHRAIAERAYFKSLDRGRDFGNDWADWFAAEQELVLERLIPRITPSAWREIEVRAYKKFLARGGVPRHDQDDWYAAGREKVLERLLETAYLKYLERVERNKVEIENGHLVDWDAAFQELAGQELAS